MSMGHMRPPSLPHSNEEIKELATKLGLDKDTKKEIVIKKVEIDKITQSFKEDFNVSILRWLPPSNSISINAIALRSGPIYPKSSIVSISNTGPKIMPISISGRTSGSFVLSKSAVNRWAAKIINPTANTNVDIVSIIPLLFVI